MSKDAKISDEERTNEVGLFNTAETYWKSTGALYDAKVKATHSLSPVLFLYYHAIELYLKAFLRGYGHSAGELRSKKFGHSICCLSDRAVQLGLWYMDEDKEVFSYMHHGRFHPFSLYPDGLFPLALARKSRADVPQPA